MSEIVIMVGTKFYCGGLHFHDEYPEAKIFNDENEAMETATQLKQKYPEEDIFVMANIGYENQKIESV